MGEIKKRWYVVRAVSGKEKKVKEYGCEVVYSNSKGSAKNAK